jgi:putative flippase GtrA
LHFANQVPRFALIGLGVTALHAVVATALIVLIAFGPVAANGCAFAVATMVSYMANTLWTFERRPQPRSFARFVLVSVVGFVLTLILAGAADALGFPFYIGLAAVVTVVPAASFAMHSLWTYRFV